MAVYPFLQRRPLIITDVNPDTAAYTCESPATDPLRAIMGFVLDRDPFRVKMVSVQTLYQPP